MDLNELVSRFWTGSFTWIIKTNQFTEMNQIFQHYQLEDILACLVIKLCARDVTKRAV